MNERVDEERPFPDRGRTWRSYKERLAQVAERVVVAQRPIRILEWVKWSNSVHEAFVASGYKVLPPIEYGAHALDFDPDAKKRGLKEIETDAARGFDPGDERAANVSASVREYRGGVEKLEASGTARLYELSRELDGSASDHFADKSTRVCDVAHDLYDILTEMDAAQLGPIPERNIPAADAVELLSLRLAQVFGEGRVRVILDDGIAADAAAGSDYVKVRRGAHFSSEDIRILEVHEGWAHVGTSLNGQRQPVARWLAKGPPRTAATQEGLAALLEVLTFTSHPS